MADSSMHNISDMVGQYQNAFEDEISDLKRQIQLLDDDIARDEAEEQELKAEIAKLNQSIKYYEIETKEAELATELAQVDYDRTVEMAEALRSCLEKQGNALSLLSESTAADQRDIPLCLERISQIQAMHKSGIEKIESEARAIEENAIKASQKFRNDKQHLESEVTGIENSLNDALCNKADIATDVEKLIMATSSLELAKSEVVQQCERVETAIHENSLEITALKNQISANGDVLAEQSSKITHLECEMRNDMVKERTVLAEVENTRKKLEEMAKKKEDAKAELETSEAELKTSIENSAHYRNCIEGKIELEKVPEHFKDISEKKANYLKEVRHLEELIGKFPEYDTIMLEINQESNALSGLKTQLVELDNELCQFDSQRMETLSTNSSAQQEVSMKVDQKSRIIHDAQKYRDEIQNLQEVILTTKKQLAQHEEEIRSIQKSNEGISSLIQAKASSAQEKMELSKKLETITEELSGIATETEMLNKKNNQEIDTLKATLKQSETLRCKLAQEVEKMQAQLSDLEAQSKKAQEKDASRERRLLMTPDNDEKVTNSVAKKRHLFFDSSSDEDLFA